MRIDELKSPYRELAKLRRDKEKDCVWINRWSSEFESTNSLNYYFNWIRTTEGYEFWDLVYQGQNPEIPESSFDELKEYQNATKDEPTKDDKLFTAAVAAMQGILSGSLAKSGKVNTAELARDAWYAAEDLIKEGKERKHL